MLIGVPLTIVLSRAARKTERQSAKVMRFKVTPVGYSTPSPLVITFVNSALASLADKTLFNSGVFLALTEAAGVGDLIAILVDCSVSRVFSSRLAVGFDRLEEAVSSILGLF